jgi:hypothetical protein
MFRKCPKLWWLSRKWDPGIKSNALSTGIAIHKEFQNYFEGKNHTMLTPAEGFQDFHRQMKAYETLEVESAYEIDFRGHTILCRPDAVIKGVGGGSLWSLQIKTSARHLSAHALSVQWSPHEALYKTAISLKYSAPVAGTFLVQYIKTQTPKIFTQVFTLPDYQREQILRSVEQTLTDMERYETEEDEAPMHTNSCYDWTTGAGCPFITVCHHGAQPEDFYGPAVNRYPEFPGGRGIANPAVPSIHQGFDKLDTFDDVA